MRTAIKWLAAWLLSVAATGATAGSLEDRYFTVRDTYIAKFSSSPDNEQVDRQHEAALVELAHLLGPIVGPVKITGVPMHATSNVSELSKGASGYGQLDGLVFASPDDKMRVVATTTALVQHWVRERKEDGVPQEIGAALRSGAFYWKAFTDSGFTKYVELPIVRPAAARLAVAVLGLRSNSDTKGTPNEVNVAVIDSERVFVATTRVAAKIDPIPACESVWERIIAKPSDQTDPDGRRRADEADAAFAQCFDRKAPSQRFFPALTSQAQMLLDLLPVR